MEFLEIKNLCKIYGKGENQVRALLKSHNPLADIYKEWDKTETHHMDDVREVIEARADAVIRAEKEKGQREGR